MCSDLMAKEREVIKYSILREKEREREWMERERGKKRGGGDEGKVGEDKKSDEGGRGES